MSNIIDLRSDTVTLPPPEMRRAMYEAELGDDVYGEDPTVNRLQERVAAMLGKEAALFVPSGTMANLVAVLTHCGRGDEVIMGDQAHMFYYEGGGSSVLGATSMRTVPNEPDGTLAPAALRAAVRDRGNPHYPRTGLICLENTHNRRGGAVLTPDYMRQVRAMAGEAGAATNAGGDPIPVHLDGARLFNAAVALNTPVAELARDVDSVYVCFSKGLAAPVGSALCGSRAFIDEALRWRKMGGGGMRQAGVIAAAALYALDHMVDRLAEDHANARLLSGALLEIQGLRLAQPRVDTNIVCIDTADTGFAPQEALGQLKEAGVLAAPFGGPVIRFVTHYGIERAHVEDTVARARRAFGNR
ncbi:MAG: low-specificity L-threonine aldolase [Chloroflexota bacterium]|nr:low-specificity L-threonine aldolase [Chloroflexota bacterium]